eukprot:9474497-Pyramimonas_sp.AAC.1
MCVHHGQSWGPSSRSREVGLFPRLLLPPRGAGGSPRRLLASTASPQMPPTATPSCTGRQ